MKKRSGILFSILWNQIFWLLPLTIALTSPILILGLLGLYHFLTGGRPLLLLGASAVLFFPLWFSLLLLRFLRLPRHFGGQKRLEAQEITEAFSEEMRQTDLTFRDWRKVLQKVLELNARIARVYGMRTPHPEMNIRLCDILLAIECISREMEQFLLNSGFSQIFKWGKLGQIFYFVPSGKKKQSVPNSAKEKKTPQNSSFDFLKDENEKAEKNGILGKWVYQPVFAYFFKRVGEYSIRINSGNLCYQSEAADSWKYPLKISISDWPGTVRSEKSASEMWLHKLREENADILSIDERRKNIQIDRLTLPEWGEILLTHEIVQKKELGIKELWKKIQTVFSTPPITDDLLSGDLLLLFIGKNEIKELLSESSESKARNTSFAERLCRWKNKPIGERPFLVCVFSRETAEELCETFSTPQETPRQKIYRALNLNENEAFVWFMFENQSEISDVQSPDAPNTEITPYPTSNAEVFHSSRKEENETGKNGERYPKHTAAPQKNADDLFTRETFLQNLIYFAESVGEKIQTRKNASISSEMKSTARSERQNRFFASRLVTLRWMLGLYGLTLFGCLVLNGVFFTQKKISRLVFPENAPSAVADSISPADDEWTNARNTDREETETQKFYRKYGLNLGACGVGGVCLLILFLFLKSHIRSQVLEVEADEYWPLKEQKVFEKVQNRVNELKLNEISGFQPIGESLRKIIELVDREYSGQSNARYSISFSEILKAQRILISRFRQTLARELPSMDYLLLQDIRYGLVFYRYYLWGFNIYRKLLWLDPASASVLELRRMVNQGALKFFGKHIASSSILYVLRLCGFYAVEIYSGNLFFSKDLEPVRVSIVGGKTADLSAFAEKLKSKTNELELPSIQLSIIKNRINEEQSWWARWSSPPIQKCEREIEHSDVVWGIFQNQEEKDLLTRMESDLQKQERPPLFWLLEEKNAENADFHELQAFFAKQEREIRRRKNKRFLSEYQSQNQR